MPYWKVISVHAGKAALVDAKLNTVVGAVLVLSTQALIALILYLTLGLTAANLPTRLASSAAPFMVLPLAFLIRLPLAIAYLDRSLREETKSLRDALEQARARLRSDIKAYLSDMKTVIIQSDEPPLVTESLIVENTGTNILERCVVRTGTKNAFNHEVYSKSWLKDASTSFSLRPGEVRSFYLLHMPRNNATGYIALEHYEEDQRAWPPRREILVADEKYIIHVEVLSASTFPALVTLSAQNDGTGWAIASVDHDTDISSLG